MRPIQSQSYRCHCEIACSTTLHIRLCTDVMSLRKLSTRKQFVQLRKQFYSVSSGNESTGETSCTSQQTTATWPSSVAAVRRWWLWAPLNPLSPPFLVLTMQYETLPAPPHSYINLQVQHRSSTKLWFSVCEFPGLVGVNFGALGTGPILKCCYGMQQRIPQFRFHRRRTSLELTSLQPSARPWYVQDCQTTAAPQKLLLLFSTSLNTLNPSRFRVLVVATFQKIPLWTTVSSPYLCTAVVLFAG